ncbi:MAG TPA: ATPase P, partial [Vicinamibacteria bacterium]|nr:ATPase P [Vicinamibacteria bacterium]
MYLRDLAGVCCAEAAAQALRASPHVIAARVDYQTDTVAVTYQAAMTNPEALAALVGAAGCPCAPAGQVPPTPSGSAAAHLAHRADLAPITMGTKQDRMQYELAATGVDAPGHRYHGAAPAPAAPAGAPLDHAAMGHAPEAAHDHAAMGHDMSDPRMARTMERDMKRRFLIALALTVPTVLYSPLGVGLLGIRLPTFGIPPAWIMLALSTPVVWWAGWIFIGGAWVSLRYRTLNMSVLIATGVLAAYLFSVLLTLTGGEEVFYEAAAMLVTFVLFGHWMEMKSRRGTTDALRALFDLVPPTATVLRD